MENDAEGKGGDAGSSELYSAFSQSVCIIHYYVYAMNAYNLNS